MFGLVDRLVANDSGVILFLSFDNRLSRGRPRGAKETGGEEGGEDSDGRSASAATPAVNDPVSFSSIVVVE